MNPKNQNILALGVALLLSALFMISCDPEVDALGSQFFQNGAVGTEESYDIVVYNNNHLDSLQSNGDRIAEASLGVFDESNFGRQKASYVTQMKLTTYDPDFGNNAVVDSVVLVIKPLYYTAADSVKTTTYEDYVHPEGNLPAKKVITTYPIKKYGKAKLNGSTTQLTVNVHEVDEFLDANQTQIFSNKQVALGAFLGSKTFDGNLRAIKITKDADNSELYSKDAGLRIPLDKDIFQNKIINKKGSFELKDAASFIRYFKGLRISVAENDGYLFNFNPNEVTATIFYKYDKTENNTTTRVQNTYAFDLGASNIHFSQIQYQRPSSFTTAMNNINRVAGDPKIYLQGMGGPGAEIKIPASTVAQLKTLFNTQKIGILSAKIKLYTDPASWNNSYAKPSGLSVLLKQINQGVTSTSFLDDYSVFQYSGMYRMVNAVDLDKNPAYYELGITQTLRNMVEKESTADKFITVEVGEFRVNNSTGGLIGKNSTTRAYTPNRIVLVGSDPSNAQYKAQLKVIYAKK